MEVGANAAQLLQKTAPVTRRKVGANFVKLQNNFVMNIVISIRGGKVSTNGFPFVFPPSVPALSPHWTIADNILCAHLGSE